jgi:predicted N-formylglutamate amidohydrolase
MQICSVIQCDSFHILHEDSWAGRINGFFTAMWNAVFEILERSYVSLGGVVTLLMVSFFFVPTKLSRRRRVLLGFLHAAAHLTSAVLLMLLMELAIEICIRNHLLATSGSSFSPHLSSRISFCVHCCLITYIILGRLL